VDTSKAWTRSDPRRRWLLRLPPDSEPDKDTEILAPRHRRTLLYRPLGAHHRFSGLVALTRSESNDGLPVDDAASGVR
jgi:hypothetical protein